MPSGVLFQRLVPFKSMSLFLRELSRRSFEETRLVLLFFANMFRFCFFNRVMNNCPLCLVRLDASHHFDCPQIRAHSPIEISDWRRYAQRGEWQEFFDLLFFVSLLWSTHVRSVRCGHSRTINHAFRIFLG
jgi:hypothetical protein